MCGVPQGSIFGTLLFTMIIMIQHFIGNDVPTDLNADDTTLFVIGEKQYYSKQNLQTAL